MVPKWLWGNVGSLIIFFIVWQSLIHFYFARLGERKLDAPNKGALTLSSDKILSLFSGFERMQLKAEPVKNGWREAGKKFGVFYQGELDKGISAAGSPVVCNDWRAAQIDYYFCFEQNLQMIGLSQLNDLHEYMWMNNKRREKVNFTTAYCIVPSDDIYNVRAHYSSYYSQIDSATTIRIERSNRPSHIFYVYRLTGWKNNLPVIE